MKIMEKSRAMINKTAGNEDGVIGYGIAWLLGVPISVLVVIYLIFGR